jgi:short-subunit dehydrogenase
VLLDDAIDGLTKVIPRVRAIPGVADLSTAEGTAEFVRKVLAVDILVNSVGFCVAEEFQEIADQDCDEMMNLNFPSGVRLSPVYLQRVHSPGTEGRKSEISYEHPLESFLRITI